MEWDVFLLASKGTDWTRSQFGGCAKWHQQEGEGRVLCLCVSHSVASDSLWLHGLEPTRLLCPWSSPGKILEWVGFPFSRGSSQPRDGTQFSCIAGNFLTRWATREAWVGLCWPKNKTTETLSISACKKNFYRRRRRKKKGKTGDIKIKKTEIANGLCKTHLRGSASVTHWCHLASISFEIQMCLKRRQNQGRMKGSLSLTVSLKIRFLVFGVASPLGPQCLVDQSNWMMSPSSGEKGLADIGPQTSGPLRWAEIATNWVLLFSGALNSDYLETT